MLAAGGSRRLGRPKQRVRVAGETLAVRACRAALDAGCDPTAVVLGAGADAVADDLAAAGLAARAALRLVRNPRWEEGLASSLSAGVAAVEAAGADAVLCIPCDLPALDAAHLRALVGRWDGDPRGAVASAYAGTLGAPALFGRARFAELQALTGDRGARDLLRGAAGEGGPPPAAVEWPAGAADVDRPGDVPGGFTES